MKSLTRVALYALVMSIVPLSYTYADDAMVTEEEEEPLSLEEAAALINQRKTASDAIGGMVSGSIEGYYDIYSRQLSFREKTKVFRGSIEVRREQFEGERLPALNTYKDIREDVYRAETAAYQDAIRAAEEEEYGMMEDEEETTKKKKSMEPEMVSYDPDEPAEEEGASVKEIPVPQDAEAEGDPEVKKKVVTSDDAPDFDPENL